MSAGSRDGSRHLNEHIVRRIEIVAAFTGPEFEGKLDDPMLPMDIA